MWKRGGLGFSSPIEAALSESRFLCSKFHYIRAQRTVEEELGDSWDTVLEHNRALLNVNMLAHRWK